MRQNHASLEIKIKAVKNFLNGEPVTTIARNIGRDPSAIYRWIQRYKDTKEFTSLEQKTREGRPKVVTENIVKSIEKDLEKPASEFNFDTDLWTCTKLHTHLRKKYKIKISRGHVWKILKDAGFSYQKPERRNFSRKMSHLFS